MEGDLDDKPATQFNNQHHRLRCAPRGFERQRSLSVPSNTLRRVYRRLWHHDAGVGYTNLPQKGRRAELWEDEGKDPQTNIEQTRKKHLDAYGIDIAVLTGATVYGAAVHPNSDYGTAMCRAFNDWTLDTWIEADSRFRASIAIAPTDPQQAAQEIHRLGGDPRVFEVIMPAGARMPFGNRFYHPIYEAAQEHGFPVCVHFGAEGAGVSNAPTAAGYPSYYLEMRMSRPQIAMAHVVSLICEGVFEKFPRLKFLLLNTTPSGYRD